MCGVLEIVRRMCHFCEGSSLSSMSGFELPVLHVHGFCIFFFSSLLLLRSHQLQVVPE